MPGMPYHLEKGAWGAVFEDFLNGGETAQRAVRTLYDLRNDVPLTELGFFRSPSLDDRTDHRYGGRARALPTSGSATSRSTGWATSWTGRISGRPRHGPMRSPRRFAKTSTRCFGRGMSFAASTLRDLPPRRPSLNGPGLVTLPCRTAPSGSPRSSRKRPCRRTRSSTPWAGIPRRGSGTSTTAWWRTFFKTFATAIEVALGLEWRQGSQLDELGLLEGREPPCRLPIEVFWKCPQRWFEGWVTWRTDGRTPASGQVTVILATPGSGTPLLERPGFGRNALVATGPMAKGEPAISFLPGSGGDGSLSPKGMWVVSHEDHVSLPPPTPGRPATTRSSRCHRSVRATWAPDGWSSSNLRRLPGGFVGPVARTRSRGPGRSGPPRLRRDHSRRRSHDRCQPRRPARRA